MSELRYTVKPTSQFKRDYKLAIKRGLNIQLLEDVVTAWLTERPCKRKTETMPCPEIG